MRLNQRKTRRRGKTNWTRYFLIAFALIFLSIIIIYLGVKLILGILFLSSRIAPSDKIQEKTQQQEDQILLPANITVYEIPEATNSAPIKIKIQTENIDKLEVFLNNESVDKFDLTKEILEDIKIDKLQEGENEVFFIGRRRDKNEKVKSRVYTVVFDSTPPELKIESPEPNLSTIQDFVIIKGQTEQETRVFVDNISVVVLPDGNFEYQYFLKEGENKIIIKAIDKAGNQTEKELTVIKEMP